MDYFNSRSGLIDNENIHINLYTIVYVITYTSSHNRDGPTYAFLPTDISAISCKYVIYANLTLLYQYNSISLIEIGVNEGCYCLQYQFLEQLIGNFSLALNAVELKYEAYCRCRNITIKYYCAQRIFTFFYVGKYFRNKKDLPSPHPRCRILG